MGYCLSDRVIDAACEFLEYEANKINEQNQFYRIHPMIAEETSHNVKGFTLPRLQDA